MKGLDMSLEQASATRPTLEQIQEAIAQASPGTVEPSKHFVGISDPHTTDLPVLDLIHETGTVYVRAEFHWSIIEASEGNYDWSAYDAMVDHCNALGLKVQAIVTYLPSWLPPDWAVIDEKFQAFATACVQRYAAKGVHLWECFNEPNLPGYGWLLKGMDAADFFGPYLLLLARFNKIVRDNDPEGVVILGGIANHSEAEGYYPIENVVWGLGHVDAHHCYDVFAFHPYGYQNNFAEARARIDAAMGAVSKPIWFNEYGWTGWQDMDMAINPDANTNPLLATFYNRVHCDALFHFSLKDYSSKWGTPTFGLCDFNLNKRPGFETFKAAQARVAEIGWLNK